jgi:hypothetical protein
MDVSVDVELRGNHGVGLAIIQEPHLYMESSSRMSFEIFYEVVNDYFENEDQL